MAGHTLPPYHLDKYSLYLWGSKDEMVGDSRLDDATKDCPEEGGTPMLRARGVGARLPIDENMAFIARACNSHDDLLTALKAIKQFGELSNVSVGDGYTGGKKPASKDVWQFPRHMLVEIDAAIAKAEGNSP